MGVISKKNKILMFDRICPRSKMPLALNSESISMQLDTLKNSLSMDIDAVNRDKHR